MCHRRALLIDLEPRVLNQVNNEMPGLFNQARAPSPHGRPHAHARHMHLHAARRRRHCHRHRHRRLPTSRDGIPYAARRLRLRLVDHRRLCWLQENIYRHPEGGGAGNNWAMGYDMAQSVQEDILEMIDREVRRGAKARG